MWLVPEMSRTLTVSVNMHWIAATLLCGYLLGLVGSTVTFCTGVLHNKLFDSAKDS